MAPLQAVAVELCQSREVMLHPMDQELDMTLPIMLQRLRHGLYMSLHGNLC
jgi:hypothetical protein